jgi:outer membrane protein OmpA-like peptidoglycan-associated protein
MKTRINCSVISICVTTAVLIALQAVEARSQSIPLCPGLTLVTAVSQPTGDYESLKTIQTISPEEITLRYSAETKNDIFSTGPELKSVKVGRTMLVKDLQSATDYQQIFLEKGSEEIPGTTSIGTSAAVLQNLKTKGKSDFGYSAVYSEAAVTADRNQYPNYYSYLQRGTIERVAEPATLPVIVNDVETNLPIVHAQGAFIGDKIDIMFLDDPANPLTLAFRFGIKDDGKERDSLRVTKIAFTCQAPNAAGGGAGQGKGLGSGNLGIGGGGSGLEAALAKQQKVDVYSIYFSFNSDALREESAPTLKEIADILTRHPDWRLAVNGHTDGVGADQYNLDLSKRRAAAVVKTLVTNYHIAPGRLRSAGFGKSQPKDTNDTLEGRARNRRVELTRF